MNMRDADALTVIKLKFETLFFMLLQIIITSKIYNKKEIFIYFLTGSINLS